jgi:ferric-dicitrate binding protein FerR (iron transport regulator)
MTGQEPRGPIESLLKLAGERDQPSAQATARARAAAVQSWQRALAQRAGPGARRVRIAWALAAGVAALVITGVSLRSPAPVPDPPVTVATVSAVQGEAALADGQAVGIERPLRTGDVLVTGAGRVALMLGDSLSLRVDQHTRLRLDGAGRVTLEQGGVYVDSGGLSAQTRVDIHTPAGVVLHRGTQYLVRVSGAQTRVQVREGRVAITRIALPSVELAAGDRADVRGAEVRLHSGLPAFGADWEWAAETAPGFDIENRPLSEFLAWLAREHGWQLSHADTGIQARTQEIRLHGSLQGLDEAAMLERVSLITGVPLSQQGGVLRVGAQ